MYLCGAHFPAGSPDFVAAQRVDSLAWLLVIDPAFTRDQLGERCACGLPADHRHPMAGEPRGCLDETARIAIPSARPTLRPPAPVLALPSRGRHAGDDVYEPGDLAQPGTYGGEVFDRDDVDQGDDVELPPLEQLAPGHYDGDGCKFPAPGHFL